MLQLPESVIGESYLVVTLKHRKTSDAPFCDQLNAHGIVERTCRRCLR